jgi:predicted PurR-regulated permease PerM
MEYRSLARFAYLVAGLIIGIWFLHLVIDVMLLMFFAIVIAIVLNAPVTWMQKKKIPRTAAALIVFLTMLAIFALIGWMVIPKIVTQVKLLVTSLPDYIDRLNLRITEWIGDTGASKGNNTSSINPLTDQLPPLIKGIGQYSMSIFNGVFMTIFFFCIVIYLLINPKPLLKTYLSFFPEQKRDKAAEAFSYASTMTIGWMWSNVAAGALRATIVWFFLYFMNIPGVWVWAGVTFFAELIPKLGFYIMSVPPILIAFSISPRTALWVTIFYIALDEIIGDFVLPRIRSKTMKIHPVPILVMLLAMTAAFGIMGAFIATPLAAFIKAYYEIFYQKKLKDEETDSNIDKMLFRN